MSLPEIIPSALPQFVRNTPRTNFSNSIVPSGAVLLFAESDGNGGSNLLKKLPDGSFKEVGGGGTNFYKCASVDTSNSEWSGYQAVIDGTTGIWSFSSTLTTGLTYDNLTPEVPNVYAGDACIYKVSDYYLGIPENGLVFYASLNGKTPSTAETGQTLNQSGTATYNVTNLVPCVFLPNYSYPHNNYLYTETSNFPSGNSDRTISFWVCPDMSTSFSDRTAIFYGAKSTNKAVDCRVDGNAVYFKTWGTDLKVDASMANRWTHVTFVVSNGYIYIYLNGSLAGSLAAPNMDTVANSTFYIGRRDGGDGTDFKGYIAAVRVYNRVLTSNEISALANEFSPTPISE